MTTPALLGAIKKPLRFTGLMIIFLILTGTLSCKTCNCPAYTYEKQVPVETALQNDNS